MKWNCRAGSPENILGLCITCIKYTKKKTARLKQVQHTFTWKCSYSKRLKMQKKSASPFMLSFTLDANSTNTLGNSSPFWFFSTMVFHTHVYTFFSHRPHPIKHVSSINILHFFYHTFKSFHFGQHFQIEKNFFPLSIFAVLVETNHASKEVGATVFLCKCSR